MRAIANLKEFAEKADLSRNTLDRIKNTDTLPRRGTLELIDRALKRFRPKVSS